MTPEEQQMLSALADRIKAAPAQNHDADADRLLSQMAADRPDAVYLLAQTVLMQDFALRNAQAQISSLQQQLAQAPAKGTGGSFLSGLFGGSAPPSAQPASVPPVNPWARQPQPQQQVWQDPGYGAPGYAPVVMQPSQTGGFLRSAATTAAGIAGGALLFQGIESLFSGHSGMGYGGGGFVDQTGWGGGPRESLSETTVVNNYYGDVNEGSGTIDASTDATRGDYQDTSYTDIDDSSPASDGSDWT